MKYIWDLDSNRLVREIGSTAPAPGAEFKFRCYHLLQLQFVRDGEAVSLEADTPTITFGIKVKGKFDDGFLVETTTFTYDEDLELYECEPSFAAQALLDELKDNSDTTDDEAAIDCTGEFQYTLAAAPTQVICHQGFIDVTIRNKVIRGDEVAIGDNPALFEITNDELRVRCPDGTWRRAILSDLA